MANKSILEIAFDITEISKSKGKKSAIFITDFLVTSNAVFINSVKESVNFIYGYCETGDIKAVRSLLDSRDNKIDFIFIHSNLYTMLEERHPNVLIFDDRKCWFDSVYSLVQILYSRKQVNNILLAGDSWLLHQIVDSLFGYSVNLDILEEQLSVKSKKLIAAKMDLEDRCDISLISEYDEISEKYDMVISTAVKKPVFTKRIIKYFDYPLIAIDAGIGGFSKEFVQQLYVNRADVYRVDIRSALSAFMLSAIENIDLIDNVKGELIHEGIRVVAGGEMGMYGDVIVDNITSPGCIIGIADGAGQTLYPPYDKGIQSKIDIIESFIKT